MRPITIFRVCLLCVMLAACAPAEQTPEMPTVAVVVVPTETPTPSPTITLPPTWTPTPTESPTPTNTPTPTPSDTPTPTDTYTPSITPTFTITPTATSTPTPSNTPTPTATPTSAVAKIDLFEAVPSSVLVGGQVVLNWETDADRVLLEVLDKQTNVQNIFVLPPRGEQVVSVPQDLRDLVIFSMTAQRGDTEDTLDRPVTLECRLDWFFNEARRPDVPCPVGEAISGIGTYQRFERGFMVYLPFARHVYVLYGSLTAGTWVYYGVESDNIIPPEPDNDNLYAPQNQFTATWLNTEALNGNDWEDEIGFGVNPAVQTTVYAQDEEGAPVFYIGTANGFLFRLRRDPNQANVGFWELVP